MLLFIILFLFALIVTGLEVLRAKKEQSITLVQVNTDKTTKRLEFRVVCINRRRFIIWKDAEGKTAAHFELTIYKDGAFPHLSRITSSDKGEYIYIDSKI